ncbi:hypothetical protein GCM10020254_37420 [Streptomyces goshikiensis]
MDLHTDGDDPARLARLAAMSGGLRPGVTIGPCGGLSRLPLEAAHRAADQLAAAGVRVTCLPQGDCAALERRGLRTAPVRLLRAAGVRVAAGSGALRDAGNPVGRGDPLEAAYLLASQGGLRPTEAYASVSAAAREAMGLPEVRVEAGFPAELLAVRGDRIAGGAVPGVQPDRDPPGAGGSPYECGAGVLRLRRRGGPWTCPGRAGWSPGPERPPAVRGRGRPARRTVGACASSSRVDTVRSRCGWSGCSPHAGTRSRASSAIRHRATT